MGSLAASENSTHTRVTSTSGVTASGPDVPWTSENPARAAPTAMKTIGLYGLSWDRKSPHSPSNADFARGYVQSIAMTIAGGTSEIQRNIIAQRGLGMPRE